MNLLRLLRSNPYSRVFGFDRGMPIDRYYIEEFLNNNRQYIKGDVIEIADNTYTKKYGTGITNSIIMHVQPPKESDNIIIADLGTGRGVEDEIADCFILTQTLLCIYDLQSAAKNAFRLLKKGGTLLVTVPGITQISRYDMDRWGHFWSFTDLSLKTLFGGFVPSENIDVITYGNVKAAAAFLYGLSSKEIGRKDLNINDKDYQIIIAGRISK